MYAEPSRWAIPFWLLWRCRRPPPEAKKWHYFEECSMCINYRKYHQKWPLGWARCDYSWQRTWLWKMETNSHYSWYIQNPSSSAERGQIDDSTQKEVHVLGHFFHMVSLKDNLWNFGFKQDGTTSRDCNRGYAENTRYHCSWGLNWCALASSPPFAMAFFRWYATNWYWTCMPNITSHLQANCWQSSSLYQGNTFHCTWEISHWATIDCPAQVGKPGPWESDWSTDHGAFTWCYSPDQLEHTERYQDIANIRALQTCCISWIRLRTWRSCMHLLCFHCLKPSWTSETSHASTWFAEAIHPPGWLSTGHRRWNATTQTLQEDVFGME